MSIARDQRGASIVELALVLPILASLLIGMVDLSRAYSHKLKLEQAAQRGIEKVQQYQATSTALEPLQAEVAAAGNVRAGNVKIDTWLECNGARATDFESVCPSGQTFARWISVDVTDEFKPIFKSRHFPGANSDGSLSLKGTARMRTQ